MNQPSKEELREILDLAAEAGQLKRVPRSGWSFAGIPHPESVADHVFRAAVLGHLLARMEGVDAGRVVLMILYHDLAEARLNDAHRIAARYLDKKGAESRALADLLDTGLELKREIRALIGEEAACVTREAIIARDADRLECILQGREYLDAGFAHARQWCEARERELSTESARCLYAEMQRGWDSVAWRRGLSEEER